MVKFFINNKMVTANSDETILQVARREGFYIPTMCYLTKTKPIASCRMCLVESELNDDKDLILSCQEKPVENLKITTDSAQLFTHRQNIMKMYDVNHPLQCGVCDKSGECELQNKTLEFKVDTQNFSAIDQKRDIKEWGYINYDPSLCIMCEKCVRVSNEITGNEALKVKSGGYGSTIINVKNDKNDASLAESASVCPVGALTTIDFKYRANAWEMTKIPALSAHCSCGCEIDYEIKTHSVDNNSKTILRVTNDSEFETICPSARFGYDFANSANKDEKQFNKAIDAIKNCDGIRFSSIITNEEAMILQKISEKLDIKLINDESKNYQSFLNNFSKTSGISLYSGDDEDVKKSDFIISFGLDLANDEPLIKYAVNNASKLNRAEFISLHPLEDSSLNTIVTKYIRYEVGSEEGVIALLVKELLYNLDIDEDVQDYLDDLDDGYISAESNVGEEEIEDIIKRLNRKKNPILIVGKDLYNHPQAKQIAKFIGLIEKYTNFKTLITPPNTNSLGVALICDLKEAKISDNIVGYNACGDFEIGAVNNCDLPTPAFNQQEGTITTRAKRVKPTNVALPFGGYNLNDIANSLGLESEYTIDYTPTLPIKKGFKKEIFDELKRSGYKLELNSCESKFEFSEVEEIDSFDGVVIYLSNPAVQKNRWTANSKVISQKPMLVGTKQFAIGAKIKDKTKVKISFDNIEEEIDFVIDQNAKGVIAKFPTFNLDFGGETLASKYRFIRAKIMC